MSLFRGLLISVFSKNSNNTKSFSNYLWVSSIIFIFLCILQKFPNKCILILWTSPIIPVIKWHTFEQNFKSGLNRTLTTGWLVSPRWYIKKFMKNYSSPVVCIRGFPGRWVVNNLPTNARVVSGSGRSPGEGNGNPFQYYCLGSPMDRGAWRATDHCVAKELNMTEHQQQVCVVVLFDPILNIFFIINFNNDIIGTIMRFTI